MANRSHREIETAIKVTFTTLGYLAANPDAMCTCHTPGKDLQSGGVGKWGCLFFCDTCW